MKLVRYRILRYYYFAALIVIFILSIRVATAQVIGNCDPSQSSEYLDVNNVRARILNNGNLFYRGEPHVYRVPRFSESNAIFAASIWVGGLIDEQLHVAATRYGPYEFWAGPLDDNGNPPDDCDTFDRIYKVNRQEIAAYEQSGMAAGDLATWPTGLGAPTIDSNGIRIDLMHLLLAERKDRVIDLAAGERPDILGDQGLWWVMNDRGNTHDASRSPSLGIEVHGFAYAMSSSVDALNDATLYRYRIFNRNSQTIERTYFGVFFDPDLGDAGDDYVGTDTLRGIAFVYNADNSDVAREGYGDAPPAVGFRILKGPLADDDGFDNDRDGLIDEPGERMRMSHTQYYNGGGGVNEDPQTGLDYYRYMQSIWKNGQPVTYGGNGYDLDTTSLPTNYFYPGDPVTSSYWSEMNPSNSGWSNPSSDRRFIVSNGPFDLAPGQSKELDFAVVYGRGEDHLDSITEMRRASDEIQAVFDSGFRDYPPSLHLDETVRQLSPADGMVGQPLNPTLHWNPVDAAEGYLVEMSTADTSYQTAVRDPFLALDDLVLNTEYTWRVRGENRYGVSSWSKSWQFYTGTHSYGYDIDGFTVVQNANGPLDPPDMGAFAINNSGFPTLPCPTDPDVVCLSPTRGYQQARSDAVWGIHTGLSNRTTYSSFVSASLNARGHTIENDLRFDDFEWRFSERCADEPNSCLGWRRFDDEVVMEVPFEIWNIGRAEDLSDDYRMVPAVLNEDGPDRLGFDIGGDHPISDGDDDPFTDRVYWFNPADTSVGDSGYQAFMANPGSTSPELGNELISRTVLVQLDGGNAPPYNVEMPEPGTIFRITTRKPTTPTLAAPGNLSRVDSGRVSFYWHGTGLHRLQIYNAGYREKILDETDLLLAYSIDLEQTGNYLWRVQSSNGLWSQFWTFKVVGTNDGKSDVPLPSEFRLFENFPNPFSTSTTIRYHLTKPADVHLVVFNPLGKRVRVLENKSKPAGEHEITFDATGLASGIYFYTLRTGEFSQTQKMVVVK